MYEINSTDNLPMKRENEENAMQKTEYKSIEQFQMFLNKAPAKSEIKQNQYAGNSKYIPIGTIEQRLDEIYAGLWSDTDATFQVVANSILCHLNLKVFHPIAKTWIERSGVGAIPIQLNQGEKEMSFSTIKSDAIKKNAPAAKSQALRNAAQSLGAVFGRNLNREDVGDYQPISEQVEQYEPKIAEANILVTTSTLSPGMKTSIEADILKASSKKLDNIITYLKTVQ